MLITTPSPTERPKSDKCYCPQVTSDRAIQFREDIAPFRFLGDPDGEYELVVAECSNPVGDCLDLLDAVC